MSATDPLGALFSSLRERFGLAAGFQREFEAAVRGFQRSPLPTREEIKHSERLEFLGDSCLQFCITRILHREFPDEDEGVLSSVKGSIVSGATLAEVAEGLGFASVAAGATTARLKSFLPDVFEAFLGAWFLHAGISEVGAVIDALLTEQAKSMVSRRSFKSLKSMIQEIAAKELGADPQYRFQRLGAENKFRAFVVLGGNRVAQGTGGSKKEAEDKALERLFPRLNEVFAKMGKAPGRRGRRGATRGRPERAGRGSRDGRSAASREAGEGQRRQSGARAQGQASGSRQSGQRGGRSRPARRPASSAGRPASSPSRAERQPEPEGWVRPAESAAAKRAEDRDAKRPAPDDGKKPTSETGQPAGRAAAKSAGRPAAKGARRAAGRPSSASRAGDAEKPEKTPAKKAAKKPDDDDGGWVSYGGR